MCPRQLEAAREPETGALMGGQSVDPLAGKGHAAVLVAQRAADAIDERRLSGTVRADEAEPFALGDGKVDRIERDEAAEALADAFHLEERRAHGLLRLLNQLCHRPTMPFGATITKPTKSRPTISRLTADEIVTVAI